MSGVVDPEIERYALEHTTPEPEPLRALAEETRATLESHGMMVGALEGRFLATLVGVAGARRVLEIGMFTGYSALSMAAALPPGGQVVTCELDPDRAAIARRHIDASPWADRIEIRMGAALDTLSTLDGPFDLVFVDADKREYARYYEAALPLLADRGLMVVDNVLWAGKVLDGADPDEDTRAIVAFNDQVAADPRVETVMLTIRDGVSLIRRR